MSLNGLKPRLISELWLPGLIKCGKLFYPKRRYKDMNVLTLTSSDNYDEIGVLLKENLASKESIKVLTNSLINVARLNVFIGKSKIVGPANYEDAISDENSELFKCFPFDIINLDFSSQDPNFIAGRLENEIANIEKTFILQKSQNVNKFAIIYTSLINSYDLNLLQIRGNSNCFNMPGWGGVLTSGFPDIITVNEQKIGCIENLLIGLSNKYNYSYDYEKLVINFKKDKQAFSILGIMGT